MLFLAVALLLTPPCGPGNGNCEKPVSAASIVDSIGVDIHLHYQNTGYGNFPLVYSLLKDLGVRHTRDGLIDTTWQDYYERHITLAKLGIRCLFVTSPQQSTAMLRSWPNRVPGAFEGYEAPNEYDRSGSPDWATTLRNFTKRLYDSVKVDSPAMQFTIVGPSLTKPDSYIKMTNSEQYIDVANLHNYFGGRNPGTSGWGDGGYGSIEYNVSLAKVAWPNKLIMTTETGYITDPTIPQGITELVASKYVPRLILEQTLHGVYRTYIYELIDEGAAIAGNAGSFGLVRIDGSHKASFTALKDLISILSDQSQGNLPPSLQFKLVNASSNLHHLLIAKRDGSYYLAFWLEEPDYDVNTHKELNVTPERFSFVSNLKFGNPQLITLGEKGTILSTPLAPMDHALLTATDCVSFLVLR